MKKFLSLFLSLVMILTVVPAGAITSFAAETDVNITATEDAVAKVGDTDYTSFVDAVAAAKSGDTITLMGDVTLDAEVTLPAGVTLDGNGKQINGTIYAGGDLTFAGHTKVTAFSASYYDRIITIGEDACLEITGTGRVTLGYGNTFNITGTIDNAKTADKADIQPSLIIPGGMSITGGSNATMNVTNAYVVIGSTTSKNSVANGTFKLNFTNSIAEFTNQLTFAEPTSGKNPTFNVNIKDSVLTTGTKFIVAAPNSDVVIDNSVVTLSTNFRNSGMFTLQNGSVMTGATIQFGENGGNNGTIIVDNSDLTITASSTGHALDGKGTGKIELKNDATASIGYIKDMSEIKLAVGTELKTNSSDLLVIDENGKAVEYKEEGSFAIAGPVKVATYEELVAALAEDNAYVKMTADITATATQNSGYGVAGIVIDAGDILDGNGKTLTINGANSDWGCAIAMRGGEVKNLTIAGAFRGVFMPGANGDVVIDNCEFKNVVYTFNSDAGSKDYTVTIKNTTLNGWTSFSNAHKSVTFDGCTFGKGSGYAFLRPYQATTFVNCKFAEGFKCDTKATAENSLEFNDCTYNEVPLSSDNNAMFYNGGYVKIDGEDTNVNPDVAKIGDKSYKTLAAAVAEVKDGGTIKLISNITFDKFTRTHNSGTWYDGLYYVGDKSFTIDLGGYTITHDGSVNDYLLNFKNDGSKANVITLKNGTVDAGTSAYCAICTSSASTQEITINLENINLVNNISNGSVAKIRGGAVLNVNDGTVITGKNSYLGIECIAATVNINDGAKIYMNGTGSYNGCLVGVGSGGIVNVNGGYGKGVKGGFIAMTSGGTINVYGGEWIANTDGTVGDNSNLYVLTAQNNKYESGYVGASVINVYGGTLRGGMDAWVLNDAKVEKAELNISGGNFNANPERFVTEGCASDVVDGIYTIKSLKGSGTEADPYQINNIDDLILFRDLVNSGNTYAGKYVKLTADIDLTGMVWAPIGDSNYDKTPATDGVHMFAGNFDGGNHTIKGLSSVGYVPAASETASTEYSFGLFGYVYGANISNVKFENVNIECGTRKDSAGNEVYGSGIAALIGYYVPADGKTSVIENCHVLSGTIVASNNMGGLIGHFDSQLSQPKVNVTIKDCSNAAAVTAEAREAGGILGLLNGSREGNYIVVMNGTITFKNCENTGNITTLAGGGTTCAGGLLGRDNAAFTGQRLKLIFEDCSNSGTITAYANGETHVAGLGTAFYSHGSWLVAKNCKNTGDIVVKDANNETYVGGLFAYAGVIDLINSTSTGNVDGNTYVGDVNAILFLEGIKNFEDNITGNTYYLNGGTSPEYAALVDDAANGGNFHMVETAYKTDYTFVGWYDNAELTGDAYTALDKNVKTYYAKWKNNFAAQIGDTKYATIAAAIAAVQEGETVTILDGEHSEGTIKLPATLKNVTIKGVEGAILKDMTISAADGNSYSYIGLTFDGIVFDNSRIVLTGWRNGEETIENLTITNCVFKNLNDTTNTAPVHINKDAAEAVNGFTFTNNVIDGATGGSKSGVYAQLTGKVVFTDNTINNVSFRPYVIQITTDDGVADNFVVTGNTFSGSAIGRAQGLGNNAAGTDTVNLVVSNNKFMGITESQQICYWNFNAETTTADLSKNYYDIDILNNPSKIYYNSAAANAEDLIEMGVYPYYADEAMTQEVAAPAIMVTYPVGNPVYSEGKIEYYENMLEAVPYTTNCPRLEGATITLLKDVSGAGMRFMENDMVFDLNGHTYTITAGTGSQGTNTSGFQIRPEVTTNVIFKNGTIKVAEGAPVAYMFNCYATDFIVENVTVDCTNMAYDGYGASCYVVVSREGDKVQFTGNTKVENFNAEKAGVAYSIGDTMIVGEDVDLGGTIKLATNATLTGPEGLDVVTADGYSVKFANGVYAVAKNVAKIGDTYYTSLQDAAAAIATDGDDTTIEILCDIELDKSIDFNYGTGKVIFTANKPVTIKQVKNGLDLGFTVGKATPIIVEENVTIEISDNAAGMYMYYGPSLNLNGTITGGANWGCLYLFNGNHFVGETGKIGVGRVQLGFSETTVKGEVDTNYLLVEGSTFTADGATIDAGDIYDNNNGGQRWGASKLNFINGTVVNTNKLTLSYKDSVMTVDGSSTVTAGKIEGAGKIAIDAKDLKVGDVVAINGDLSGFTGSIEVINNDKLVAEIEDGKIVLKRRLAGNGTAENPYLIGSAEELIWFQEKVDEQAADGSTQFAGKYFKLTADIDLAGINWNPIGSRSGDHNTFKGVFDGDGHTISNLYIKRGGEGLGLFANTADNAEIKNLTINNVYIESTNNSNYAGAVVANAHASTKITNVHVTGDVYISGRGYIGGIAGHGYVVMDNVSVVANEGGLITSTFWCAGGILGYGGEGTTNIMNAKVENLTITSAAGGLGAIVGMAEDNGGTQPISGSNLSAKNVDIKTYVGGYGTSYEDYAIGYLFGGNETSIFTGDLTIENVTATTASGNAATIGDVNAKIGNKVYKTVADAFAAAKSGDEVEILTAGTYKLSTSGKDITITGAVDGVVFDNIGAYGMGGANVTFNNVTFTYANNSTYKGLQHSGNLVYNDCTINGQVFLYGASETFNNCTFNQTDADNYNVWTYTAKTVAFNDCTFNSAGKSVLIYADGGADVCKVTVTDTTFNASQAVEGKAAIEMDSSLIGGIELTINNSTATGFGTGNVSKNSLWNNKKGNYTEANNDITVVVDDETVLAPVTFVAQVGDKKYATIAAAIAAANAGDTIELLADVTASDVMLIGKSVTINGNGHTVTSSANRVFRVTTSNTEVILNDVNMVSTKASSYVADIRGISIDAGLTNVKLTLNNCSVDFTHASATDWSYAVNVSGNGTGHTVTVNGGTYEGANVINAHGANNNIIVKNATLTSMYPNHDEYYGACIWVLQNQGSSVTATGNTYNGANAVVYNVGTGTTVTESDNTDNTTRAVVKIGSTYYTSLASALAAANAGDTIKLLADIELAATTNIDKSIVIDGNGKKITTADNFAANGSNAVLDIMGGATVTFKDVDFDGIKTAAIMRTVSANVVIDGCTIQNCEHTVAQGLLRLACGNATITDSKFLNNKCTMLVSFGYDAANATDVLTIDGCTFEGNTCSETAVVYYADGAKAVLTNNKFIGNTLNSAGNAATVYLGFTENNVVTGNLFENNAVNCTGTSTRVAGAIFFGYEADVSGNAFINNTASNAKGNKLGQVCTSTYYDCTIDLSGNYWGGNKPVYGKDYTVQHQTGESEFKLVSYYAGYADGAVKDLVTIDGFVARIGKVSFATLADAFAEAQDGDTIVLISDIALDTTVANTKKVTLDLNGKTITGTDKATGSFSLFTNSGELTITGEGAITLKATNDRGTSNYSSVISNTIGGKLVVENGTIEHLGGSYMAYAIDNLTNGKGTYAETVINGGTIKSTYCAIRQYLNGVEAQNILTVNGGIIEGANKSIFVQDPSAAANSGAITVGTGAALKGNVYLFVTPGSTAYPVSVEIAGNIDGEVTAKNLPANYVLVNNNGVYTVIPAAGAALYEYNGVQYNSLADVIAAIKNKGTPADGSTPVVKVITSHTVADEVVVDIDLVIDLCGNTITAVNDSVSAVILVASDLGPVSAVIKNGTIVNPYGYAVALGSFGAPFYGRFDGNLTIESGTFKGKETAAYVNRGTLIVKGGEFLANTTGKALIACNETNYADNSAKVAVVGGKFYKWSPADFAGQCYKVKDAGNEYFTVALEHEPNMENATCEASVICKVCKIKLETKKEHVFGEYVSNNDATCRENGTLTATCIYGCGASQTIVEENSKVPHTDEKNHNGRCDYCNGDLCENCGDIHNNIIYQWICAIKSFFQRIFGIFKK